MPIPGERHIFLLIPWPWVGTDIERKTLADCMVEAVDEDAAIAKIDRPGRWRVVNVTTSAMYEVKIERERVS